MKKLQLSKRTIIGHAMMLCCLISSSGLLAQVQPSPSLAPNLAPATQTFAQEMDYIFGPLDKSQVTTGVLYDRVFPAAGLSEFTGTSGSLATNSIHFLQAYWETYDAAYQKQGTKSPEELVNQLEAFHPDPTFHHPIGILRQRFNQLREDALEANLIREQDGRYYDVAGRPYSPYNTRTSFLASPLFVEGVNLKSGRHYFYVDSRFILGNTGLNASSVQSVSINYNGTVVTRPIGTPLPLDLLPSLQDQTLTLGVTLTNGVEYVLPIDLPGTIGGPAPPNPCDGGTKLTVQGDWFDGGYGTGGYSAKGTAYIYFAYQNCSEKKLRKPIVFLDGFDPDNSRDRVDIYGIINEPFPDVDNPQKKLAEELRSRGYDIVIVDYDKTGKYDRGGSGHIENR